MFFRISALDAEGFLVVVCCIEESDWDQDVDYEGQRWSDRDEQAMNSFVSFEYKKGVLVQSSKV